MYDQGPTGPASARRHTNSAFASSVAPLQRRQEALRPSTMLAPSSEAAAEYRDSLSLEEIERLEPQLLFPIDRGWSKEEIKLIESWESPLRATGFLQHLVVLPESLSSSCDYRISYHCGIERNRRTTARFNANALLLVSAQTEVGSFANGAVFLNATIVDIWCA